MFLYKRIVVSNKPLWVELEKTLKNCEVYCFCIHILAGNLIEAVHLAN
jgi:hypothetical protein